MFSLKQVPLYLRKLVAVSLLLGILPVVFLGLYSYYKSTAVVKQELSVVNMNTIFLTEMRVEQLLHSIDNSATQFIASPLAITISAMPFSYAHFESFQTLMEMMHGLQRYDTGIYDVTFVNLNENWLVNNTESGLIHEKKANPQIMKYAQLEHTSAWRVHAAESGSTSSVNLIRKIPINTTRPLGLLIINIHASKLKELISQNTDHHILVLDEYYEQIVSNSNDSSHPRIDEEFAHSDLYNYIRNGASFDSFQVEMNDEIYSVAYRKSDFNDWIYVSLVPMKSMSGELSSIRWATFAICFAIILLIILIAVVSSRRMYNPIGRIYNSVLSISALRNDKIENRDEMEFISQRIRQILTTNVALETQLSGQLNHLREHFMLKLLHGKVRPEETREWFQLYAHTQPWTVMGMLAVQIDTLDGTDYRERDLPLLLYAINNMAMELVPIERRLTPIIIDDYQVTLAGFQEAENYQAAIYQMAEIIQMKAKEVLRVQVSIGISSAFKEWRHASKAYQESVDVLKYRVKLHKESVLMIDDIRSQLEEGSAYPEDTAAELLDAIKRSELDRAEERLIEFLEKIFVRDASYRVYQMALGRLLVDIYRISETFGCELNVTQEGEKSWFDQLFELRTSDEIKLWFMRSIIEPTVENIRQYLNLRQFKISEMMLDIIHERYHTDLTLEICSKELNYHPNYLKRVFRNETGLNFSDYVTQYRMKIAKRLLQDPAYRVSDIAELVGYSSAQNFIRYFRKTEGVTPGEYRRKVME